MESLSLEIVELITSYLDFGDIVALISTSKTMRTVLPLVTHRISFNTGIPQEWYKFVQHLINVDDIDFDQFPHLRSIVFAKHYNQPTKLPRGLKIVAFGDDYNHPTILPDGIERVFFGYHYNQPTILPTGLRELVFGTKYNQHTILPDGVECVSFGAYYNKPTILPRGIKDVSFGTYYNQPMVLPDGLKIVTIYNPCYSHPISPPSGCEFMDPFE